MSSADAPAVETRLHRLTLRFDRESAAVRPARHNPQCPLRARSVVSMRHSKPDSRLQVVTILLGLFQVVLAPAVINPDASLPKFYILPLVSGIIVST